MKTQDIANASIDKEWYLCNLARKELTATWILTRSVWPSIFFVTAYLLFVTLIGPRFMKKREAFNLKPFILVFNLVQALINSYIWTSVLEEARFKHVIANWCHPADHIDSSQCQKDSFLIWLYYVTKLTDLLDTVLFILKKKQSQVTFLHTYHHALMVPGAWYFGLNLTGSQTIIVGGLNTGIHALMYTYYFLSALGPSMQKYLWWKIYLTRLQMLQFVSTLAYLIFLHVNQCSLPETITYPMIIMEITFLILFVNFYIRSYFQRKKKLDNITEKYPAQNKNKLLNEKEN